MATQRAGCFTIANAFDIVMFNCDEGAMIVSFLDFQRWLQEMHRICNLSSLTHPTLFLPLTAFRMGGLHTHQ